MAETRKVATGAVGSVVGLQKAKSVLKGDGNAAADEGTFLGRRPPSVRFC